MQQRCTENDDSDHATIRGASPRLVVNQETGEAEMTRSTKLAEPIECPPKVPVFPVVEVIVPTIPKASKHDIELDVSSDESEDDTPLAATASTTKAKHIVSPLRPGRKRDQPSSSSNSSSDEAPAIRQQSQPRRKQQKTKQDLGVIDLISTDEDDDDYIGSSMQVTKQPVDHGGEETSDEDEESGSEDDDEETSDEEEADEDDDEEEEDDDDNVAATGGKGKGRRSNKAVVRPASKKMKKEGYYLSEKVWLWDPNAPKIPEGAWSEAQFIHEKRVGEMQEAVRDHFHLM